MLVANWNTVVCVSKRSVFSQYQLYGFVIWSTSSLNRQHLRIINAISIYLIAIVSLSPSFIHCHRQTLATPTPHTPIGIKNGNLWHHVARSSPKESHGFCWNCSYQILFKYLGPWPKFLLLLFDLNNLSSSQNRPRIPNWHPLIKGRGPFHKRFKLDWIPSQHHFTRV